MEYQICIMLTYMICIYNQCNAQMANCLLQNMLASCWNPEELHLK